MQQRHAHAHGTNAMPLLVLHMHPGWAVEQTLPHTLLAPPAGSHLQLLPTAASGRWAARNRQSEDEQSPLQRLPIAPASPGDVPALSHHYDRMTL
jgi:hypothetical protein